MGADIAELHRLIETEKRAREEGTRALIGLIEKYSGRFQEDLARETKEREATEQTMLRYEHRVIVTDTCYA